MLSRRVRLNVPSSDTFCHKKTVPCFCVSSSCWTSLLLRQLAFVTASTEDARTYFLKYYFKKISFATFKFLFPVFFFLFCSFLKKKILPCVICLYLGIFYCIYRILFYMFSLLDFYNSKIAGLFLFVFV